MFSNWLAKFLKIKQLTLISKEVQAHYWPSCFESNFFSMHFFHASLFFLLLFLLPIY